MTGSDYMGKMINHFHFDRVAKMLVDDHGGEVICGGRTNRDVNHIEPTIILNPKKDSLCMSDEIFGPILPVYTYESIDECVDFINDRDKPLAVYYFGKPDSNNCNVLKNETSSGNFSSNECIMHMASHHMGFGGVGCSGNGRYGGYEGFKAFSNRKGCLIKGPAPPFIANMILPPISDTVKARLSSFGVMAMTNTVDQVKRVLLYVISAIVLPLVGWYLFKQYSE